MQNEAIHIASEAHQSLGAQVEAVTEQIRSIKPSLDRVQNLFQQNQFAQERSGSLPHPPLGSPQNDSQMSTPTFKIRTAMKKSCNATCMCQCHKTTSLSTPLWMKNFVGLLFIGYAGTPIFRKQTCNERLCQQQSHSILKLNYYFPSWFLHRMIILRDYSSSLLADGLMISIRTPRIIDCNCDTITLTIWER